MAADLVKDDNGIACDVLQTRVQVAEHDSIVAIPIATKVGIRSLRIRYGRHALADALAACVVLAPFDIQAGLHEHIEHVRIAIRLIGVERVAPEVREHAGDRNRRRCAAR